jgi:hypothetical protein
VGVLFLKTPPFLFYFILFYILAKVIPGGYFMYLPEKKKIRAGFFFFPAFHKSPWPWVPLVGLPCMGLYSDKVCRPGGFTTTTTTKKKKKKPASTHTPWSPTLFQKTIKFLLT